jgi:hypothetical protein
VVVGVGAQVWLTVADRPTDASGKRVGSKSVRVSGEVPGIVSTGEGSTNTQNR